MIKIAPSILSADILNLEKDIVSIENAGADYLHIDVMDGHFVPNLTFGFGLIRAIKKITKLPLDVHIMIDNPDETAVEYAKAGADIVTFHVEAAKHSYRLAQAIRDAGSKAGVSLNPGTSIDHVYSLLETVDLVLVMSVNPGFSGQKFIDGANERVLSIKNEIKRRNINGPLIEVDGGVNDKTAKNLIKNGADILVSGSFVFDAKDRRAAIQSLRT